MNVFTVRYREYSRHIIKRPQTISGFYQPISDEREREREREIERIAVVVEGGRRGGGVCCGLGGGGRNSPRKIQAGTQAAQG